MPDNSRLGKGEFIPNLDLELLYKVVEVKDEIAQETGKTPTQIALNWIIHRPTISTVVVGARNEEQLKQNLGAVGWKLSTEQAERLDAASEVVPTYPYWHQQWFPQPQVPLLGSR